MNSNGKNNHMDIYAVTVYCMPTTLLENYEQFAKVMFLSAKKHRGIHEIELPMESEQGKFNFYDLKVND